MKLCLCFHCLCESYEDVPSSGRELFVSLDDLGNLLDDLSSRGYAFASPDDDGPNTVTITFDDGYYNNRLFARLARRLDIPYLIFVSAFYGVSAQGYPWMTASGDDYEAMQSFDYYERYDGAEGGDNGTETAEMIRPMTFEELNELKKESRLEIGCHGYYHQPLSRSFEKYLDRERDMAMASLDQKLGVQPRYFALANGLYTKWVAGELLKTFDRVFTIAGIPFRAKDRLVHRFSLVNPNLGGPLLQQIDKSLNPARQIKRRVRTARRMLV